MITDLLRKQLEVELSKIYTNLESFAERFFSPLEAEMVRYDAINFYFAFTHDHIYIQKHWVSPEGDSVEEVEVTYKDYNNWSGGL